MSESCSSSESLCNSTTDNIHTSDILGDMFMWCEIRILWKIPIYMFVNTQRFISHEYALRYLTLILWTVCELIIAALYYNRALLTVQMALWMYLRIIKSKTTLNICVNHSYHSIRPYNIWWYIMVTLLTIYGNVVKYIVTLLTMYGNVVDYIW